ncbi:MAG: A24 family peptidase, partial [Acidobacteriota bacterium]|nr:A24 family peptidase [Acidobacteriota bacterium]
LLAFVSGMLLQTLEKGWRGSVSGVAGTLVGASAFLVFYLLGGMGGGDIKLLAGFGAVLGSMHVLQAALWTGACGGLFALGALGVSSLRRYLRTWHAPVLYVASEHPAVVTTIPYAPAIALGVWLTLVSQAAGITA